MRKGWHNESQRHALARRGIKSAQKIPNSLPRKNKLQNKMGLASCPPNDPNDNDAKRHSECARGVKSKKTDRKKQQLLKETISNLDPLEERNFIDFSKQMSEEKALEIIVNTVEGDRTQLSPALLKYAEKKGLLEGY